MGGNVNKQIAGLTTPFALWRIRSNFSVVVLCKLCSKSSLFPFALIKSWATRSVAPPQGHKFNIATDMNGFEGGDRQQQQ